jgi:hypothetical protein
MALVQPSPDEKDLLNSLVFVVMEQTLGFSPVVTVVDFGYDVVMKLERISG